MRAAPISRIAPQRHIDILEKTGHHLFKISDANVRMEYYLKGGHVYVKTFETPYERGEG